MTTTLEAISQHGFPPLGFTDLLPITADENTSDEYLSAKLKL